MAAANPYDLQRNRIRQDSATAAQGQNDALKRRFAAMGGLNSGSYLKAQERLSGQQDQNAQRAMEGVDIQESLAAEQKAESERGRQFAREERLGSQSFASGENALARKFATSEREAGQLFSTSEREAGQAFNAGEAQKLRDFSKGESALARAFAREERLGNEKFAGDQAYLGREQQQKQFNAQADLANRQFALDTDATDFNKRLSAWMAGTSVQDLKQLGSRADLQRQLTNIQVEKQKLAEQKRGYKVGGSGRDR